MRRLEGLREAATGGIAAVALTIGVAALDPGGLAFAAREAAFDRIAGWFPRSGPAGDVIAVDIDNETLEKIGPWPWRRAQIAALVEKIVAAHPRAVALDILLDGPDRNSPRAVLGKIAADEKRDDLAAIAEGFPREDARLAAALDKGVPAILGLGVSARPSQQKFPPLVLATARDAPVDLTPIRLPGVIGPPEQISDAAAGIGILSLDIDRDGWLRRIPLLFDVNDASGGRVHAGFALETIRTAQGVGTIILDPAERRLETGALKTSVQRDGMMRLYPRSPDYWKARVIPAWRVLNDGLPQLGENTVVVAGSSAPEAGAYLPVAILGAVSTLRIQAEAIDQLLSGGSVTRPAGAPWSEWLAAAIAGTLAIVLAMFATPIAVAAGVVAILAICAATSLLLFVQAGILADMLPAAVASIAGSGVASVAIHSRMRANRALVEARFARYLAPAVVDILARNPERLRIEPQRREVTALFTDLEGFTAFGERTPPADLIATLDEYFELIARVAVEHGGMVDKIVGDAVHVFFNMPLDQPDHAERAVRCARAILAATRAYMEQPRQKALGFGRTRIGVDTGQATVGDVGGRNKLDYTAHGEAVNRAARLQSMARDFESGVLIGEGAVSKLASIQGLTSAGEVMVRGLSEARKIYTLS